MAFSGNFHNNRSGVIGFLKSYNGMQHDRSLEIQFDENADDLYDLLRLQGNADSHTLKMRCIALSHAITPCFSGSPVDDPFIHLDQVEPDDAEEPAPLDADHIPDWAPARKASMAPDSVSVGSETDPQADDAWTKASKAGHAFILHYLRRLSESGSHPEFGAYDPYDPRIAKLLAQQDAPDDEVIRLYNVPLGYILGQGMPDDDDEEEGEEVGEVMNHPSSPRPLSPRAILLQEALARAPEQQVQPRQRPLKFYETLEWAADTNFIAEGVLALRAAQRREWKGFLGTTGISLVVPAVGFGTGALIGFGVIKLGVAVIAIAGVSFPPILFVGAVVAVAATIAYCCIKKYKKSPMFTKKNAPKIPARPALLFCAANSQDLGNQRYEAFRALFEDLYKKIVEPLDHSASQPLKRVRDTLEFLEAGGSVQSFSLPGLKRKLQKWKAADMLADGHQPRVLLENFNAIMGSLKMLKTDDFFGHHKDIRRDVNKSLCTLCTKEMWDFYSTFTKYRYDETILDKRVSVASTLAKHTVGPDQTGPGATA